jgi:NADPH:quinone reductase-like Zn-dependent oxidoreductase
MRAVVITEHGGPEVLQVQDRPDPVPGELLADGTIKPVVAEAFPFDRAGDAHRFIADRKNIGKVVLVP